MSKFIPQPYYGLKLSLGWSFVTGQRKKRDLFPIAMVRLDQRFDERQYYSISNSTVQWHI